MTFMEAKAQMGSNAVYYVSQLQTWSDDLYRGHEGHSKDVKGQIANLVI